MPQRHAARVVTFTLRYWWLQILGAALFLIGLVVVLASAAKRIPLHLTLGKLSLPMTTTGVVLLVVGLLALLVPLALLWWLGGNEKLQALASTYTTKLTLARSTSAQVSTQAASQVRRLATAVRAAVPSR
ncbi:MAG TPA: hypothetical protein VF120_00670 [Ktedonobacterales bacterium]